MFRARSERQEPGEQLACSPGTMYACLVSKSSRRTPANRSQFSDISTAIVVGDVSLVSAWSPKSSSRVLLLRVSGGATLRYVCPSGEVGGGVLSRFGIIALPWYGRVSLPS